MSETLEQLTYRLTTQSAEGYPIAGLQPSFEESLNAPYFHMTCKLVRLAQEAERAECMRLAREWLSDTDAVVNVDTFIQQGRKRDEEVQHVPV